MSQTVVSLVATVGPGVAEAFSAAVARHRGRKISGSASCAAAFATARDAVQCAVEIQRACELSNRRHDLRMALHAGEVVEEDGQLVGDAIITANTLLPAVAPGEVWCTGPLRELAAALPAVEFGPIGAVAPDPLEGPRVVYRLSLAAAVNGVRTPLVGRDHERAELGRGLRQALLGRGRVVFVQGEAGVGKTHLAQDLTTEAEASGARVLLGRCDQSGGTPYLPLVEMLETLLAGLQAPDAIAGVLGNEAPQLAKIMPRLRTQLADIPIAFQLTPEQERRFLFDSVRGFLRRLSESRPLVLIFEDVHWADDASVLLLRDLAEKSADMKLFVLATCRDDPLDVQEPFAGLLEDLLRRRLAQRVRLPPLAAPEVAAMLAALALQAPPEAMVETIWAETDGNPFFIEEMYRHLDEEGMLFDEQGRFQRRSGESSHEVPDTVRLTLDRRIDRLGDSVRQVLSAAAVIGRDFPVKLLDALREVPSDELFDALERAEEARLIKQSGPGSRFTFTHELVRQTLLAGATTIRRQRLHARVADALESLADDPEQYASEIAHHLHEAGAAANPEKAVRFLAVAGQRAVAAAAYADALRYYERALEHPTPDVGTRASLLFGRGVARQGVGDWDGAVEAWHASLDAYERIGDAEGVATAALSIVRRMSASGRMSEGLATARRALSLLGESVTPGRTRLLAISARVAGLTGDYPSAEAAVVEALAAAEAMGDASLAGEVLAGKGMLHWSFMEASAGADMTTRALAAVSPASWAASEAIWELHACLLVGGRLREVAEGNEELLATAARTGNPITHWTSFLYRSLLAATEGDLATMDAFAAQGAALCERTGLPWGSIAYGYRGWVEFWRGRWEEARQWFEQAARREPPSFFRGADPAAFALCLAYRGEREQALSLLDSLREQRKLPESGVPNHLGLWIALLFAVEAFSVLGERAKAASLYPLVLEAMGTGTILDLWGGRLLERVAGLAAAAGRQWEDAEHHYEKALRQAEELPLRVERPEVRRCFAEMLFERGGPEDCKRGRHLASEAVDQYSALGMDRHAGLARHLLSSVDARSAALAPAPAPEVGAGRRPRFRLEGEVWTIGYADRVVRMRDAKGMHYLVRLLREPGREFHVLDLGTADPAQRLGGDAGPALDAQAKATYRRRLAELDDELDEALAFNDLARAARAEDEMDALKAELIRAVGLGGRDRPAASSSEKARLNVTRAIRSVIDRIAGSHPALGQHLRLTVRTGTFCSYQPDPAAGLIWDA